jgi:hypothetical protein
MTTKTTTLDLAKRAAVFHGLGTARECVKQAQRDPEAWSLYADWHEWQRAPEDVTPEQAVRSIAAYGSIRDRLAS